MAKPLTVKYERSFPCDRGMRETFAATIQIEPGETAAQAMNVARQTVEDARCEAESARRGSLN